MDHSVEPSPDPDAVAQSTDVDRDPSVARHERGRGLLRLGMASPEPVAQAHDAAVAGTYAEVLKPRELVKCAKWLERQEQDALGNLWQGAYEIALHGRSQRTRLIASKIFFDRVDPIPRNEPVQDRGPVTFNVAIVNADGRADHPQHQVAPDGGSIRTINRDGERA